MSSLVEQNTRTRRVRSPHAAASVAAGTHFATLAWGRRRQPRGILRGAPADVPLQRLRGGDGVLEHALEQGDVPDTQLEDSLRPVHSVFKVEGGRPLALPPPLSRK